MEPQTQFSGALKSNMSRAMTLNDDGKVDNRTRSKMLSTALLAGLHNILLDVEHVPKILGWTTASRFLHIPVATLSCLGGLYILLVLIKEKLTYTVEDDWQVWKALAK